MSLNRAEQMTFDYVQDNPEELRFWQEKVRVAVGRAVDDHAAARELEEMLWRYYEERAAVVSPFREVAQREGLQRTSMRNLAEYLVRVWLPVRAKKKATDGSSALPYA